MKNRMIKLVAFAVATAFAGADVYAGSGSDAKLAEVKKVIVDNMKAVRPDMEFTEVRESPVAGIYQVKVNGAGNIYISGDGKYFFPGDLIEIKGSEMVNLTEQERSKGRKVEMAAMPKEDMIVFSPKGKVKASVAVFTDVDCGYCQKIHQEVPRLNELGVEVRYLAYPRAGIGSASYKKIASAWCADNKQESLTKLKNRESIPTNVCKDNPVPSHFSLGQRVGVTGTPALVLESGELVPGYLPADRLAAKLGIL